MNITTEVEGLADLEKALLDLGAETGFKTLRSAGRKAMEPVQIGAAMGAHRDTGDMAESISIGTRKGRGDRAVNVMVGALKRGTTVTADGIKTRRKFNGIDQKVIAQEFGNQYQAADPFLIPALVQNYERVLTRFKSELAAAIDRAVKKARKGVKK